MEIILMTILMGGTIALLFYIRSVFSSSKEVLTEAEPIVEPQKPAEKEKPKKKVNERKQKEVKSSFTHKWLLTSLKGHSKRILDMDFSPNGKFLVTTSEDETVILWPVKDFPAKEHKSYRCNLDYDHSIFIKWSPDSKAFILQKAITNCIEVHKVAKRPEGGYEFGVVKTFPAKHTTDIIGLGIASTGKFIATCSDKTDLILWNLKGDVLARVDTYHNLTYCVKVSPCGRFVATSGFTSDVKVWEVKFSRAGDFEKIGKAFDLPGHRSGVYNFAFTPDSSRMATISKDGTWKVYDTNVEYNKGQDVSIIVSGSYHGDSSHPSIVAISNDGLLVCIAQDKGLRFYSVLTGDLEAEIFEVHTEPITQVLFDSSGKYVVSAGDKHARVFHNVPGHRTAIQALNETMKKNASNTSVRDRIQMQIKEAEQALANIVN